jgi:RimJ/RimL family protein N-acetyltransferase
MQIRTATDADAEPLRRYAEALFSEDLPGIFRRETPTLAEEAEFIRSHLGPENATMLLAEDEGRIIGLLAFMGRTRAEEAHGGEFGLSVAEGYRGRGIGTALIGALVAWAPEHGVSRIEVVAWSNNPGAARLYRRLGFVDEGLARAAVIRDGRPIDVHLMARLLP